VRGNEHLETAINTLLMSLETRAAQANGGTHKSGCLRGTLPGGSQGEGPAAFHVSGRPGGSPRLSPVAYFASV